MSDISPRETHELRQRAVEAFNRLRRTWEDWMTIAEWLAEGRRIAMRIAHTNEPTGKGYAMQFSRWIDDNPEYNDQQMGKATRADLLFCFENRVEVETWRSGLTVSQRIEWNHPRTVKKRFIAAEKAKAPADQVAQKKPGLREEIVALQEENDALNARCRKLEALAADGDLFKKSDSAETIARVLHEMFSGSKGDAIRKVWRGFDEMRKKAAGEPHVEIKAPAPKAPTPKAPTPGRLTVEDMIEYVATVAKIEAPSFSESERGLVNDYWQTLKGAPPEGEKVAALARKIIAGRAKGRR